MSNDEEGRTMSKRFRRIALAIAVVVVAIAGGVTYASAAMGSGGVSGTSASPQALRPTAPSALWTNCTAVHRRYPHGVGRVGARDKTSGTPVTTFKRSNLLYRLAMRSNSRLDRDKDGIACEKA
jgi:Excalibur calcium-binding domain